MFTSPRKKFTESANDVGVYVHFPYCLQKCPYCDFNSHVPKRGQAYAPYTDAVLRELDARLPELAGGRLVSIFFGGGTPSLWAPEDVARVIEKIQSALGTATEITLEANPGAVERGRLSGFKDAGVNRVSMGVQSLDNALLRQLGRIHDRDEALSALQQIQATGFDSHSIDLIYAVPGQSPEAWQATMAEVVSLETPHVSAYNLTYEPGTLMNDWKERGKVEPVSEDHEAAMFDMTYATFSAAGLQPYEVSNFAKPGHESIHNQLYWRSQAYLGVGAGAHSFTQETRRAGVKAPAAYVAAWSGGALAPAPFELEEKIAPETHVHEQLLMGLRTQRGWDAARSERELAVPALAAAHATASAHGDWCVFDGAILRPTQAGLLMNSALVLAASRALDDCQASLRSDPQFGDKSHSRINRIDGTPPPVTVATETERQAASRPRRAPRSMKFGLDILITSDDKSISLAELQKNEELAKTLFANPEKIDGAIVPVINGKPVMEAYSDPLLPLLEQWLLKLPWLLAGDTETIPMRNAEHTFGFETVKEVVDISCYLGTQNEVEEYILEPVQVPTESLCESTIGAAKQVLAVLDSVDPKFVSTQADARTLKEACVEAERALKNFRLQRQ